MALTQMEKKQEEGYCSEDQPAHRTTFGKVVVQRRTK